MPEMEHSGTCEDSELFTENQLQMKHLKLLIVPENLLRQILHYFSIG